MSQSFAAKLGRLGSESLVYGLSSIVGRLLSFLLQPYYAHKFDPAQNGVQSVVYSYIPIISIAFYLGMDVAYMRSAASARTRSEVDQRRAFTAPMLAVAAIGAVGCVAAWFAAPTLAPLLKLDLSAFRYMMLIVYSDALLAVPYAHLRMLNRAKHYAILRLIFVLASVALNIWLIGRLQWGVSGIFLANVVANVVVLALLLREIAKVFSLREVWSADWRPLWRYALPIIPAMLAVMLVENGDRIVLNYLPEASALRLYGKSAKDVVGVYSFNYKLGVVMLLVVQMFRMAWTPFALQHASEPKAPQLFSRALTGLTLVCSAVFLAVALFLPVVVRIPAIHNYVKPGYWAGLPIVPIILLGYILSGVYAVVTTGLYIERRTSALPWISGAGAALNLVICSIAARHSGLIGVAWATPAAYGLMALLGAWYSGRVFAVPFEWNRLLFVALLVAAMLRRGLRLHFHASRVAGVTGEVCVVGLLSCRSIRASILPSR